MKYIKDWKLFEELLYNDKSTKAEKGETLDFSNRLAYWNGLHKKFRNGNLTDDEKRDFHYLSDAKLRWTMDLEGGYESSVKNKEEIIQRAKKFSEAFDRLHKRYKLISKDIDYPKMGWRVDRTEPAGEDYDKFMGESRLSTDFKATGQLWGTLSKLGYVKQNISKEEADSEMKSLVNKYNDWIEGLDIPWSEVSKYLNIKNPPKAPKKGWWSRFIDNVNDSIEYFCEYLTAQTPLSKKAMKQALGEYNNRRVKIAEALTRVEIDLYPEKRKHSFDKYINMEKPNSYGLKIPQFQKR